MSRLLQPATLLTQETCSRLEIRHHPISQETDLHVLFPCPLRQDKKWLRLAFLVFKLRMNTGWLQLRSQMASAPSLDPHQTPPQPLELWDQHAGFPPASSEHLGKKGGNACKPITESLVLLSNGHKLSRPHVQTISNTQTHFSEVSVLIMFHSRAQQVLNVTYVTPDALQPSTTAARGRFASALRSRS